MTIFVEKYYSNNIVFFSEIENLFFNFKINVFFLDFLEIVKKIIRIQKDFDAVIEIAIQMK